MLSNDKPSAIYRLRGTYTPANSASGSHAIFSDVGSGSVMSDTSNAGDVHALLGISIEDISSVISQCAPPAAGFRPEPSGSSDAVTRATDPTALAEKIVKHLFNYLLSFATRGGGLTPDTYVPLGAVTKWYNNFLGKVKAAGTGFLDQID
ncbi:hypothetical protein K439DRAFT_1632457 [Ramaria rubella]|nr:hypothetical protein K439DRAFT_1632457 [Ramaria rubella]